ncbi:class I SAM-dependent methyltransferase [Solihabitans fulvus]|nr:class I SAM-dependent methyltransferase [Solihabitans fulvus]
MGYDSAFFGNAFADFYDRVYPESPDVEDAAGVIVTLCGVGGSVLELGVGTGRHAVAFVRHGLRVHGVDASQRMVEKLGERDHLGQVAVTVADFTQCVVSERFDVVFLGLNTLWELPTQELQLATLRNAGQQLAAGGRLVVDVSEPTRLHSRQSPQVAMHDIGGEAVLVSATRVNPFRQHTVVSFSIIEPGVIHKLQEVSRYVWPSELDLMAGVAGLVLTDRWSDWAGTPYSPGAERLISVYRRARG